MGVPAKAFSYRARACRRAGHVSTAGSSQSALGSGLRPLTGLDPAVARYVAGDQRFDAFALQLAGLFDLLLPGFRAAGKAHLSVGFGCTGGQHRSVAVTEWLAAGLAERGWQVSIRHRELERRSAAEAARGQERDA